MQLSWWSVFRQSSAFGIFVGCFSGQWISAFAVNHCIKSPLTPDAFGSLNTQHKHSRWTFFFKTSVSIHKPHVKCLSTMLWVCFCFLLLFIPSFMYACMYFKVMHALWFIVLLPIVTFYTTCAYKCIWHTIKHFHHLFY